jgi:flagellin
VGIDGLEVSDQSSAGSALDDIDAAMMKVASARAGFGAIQSRLEHATNALAAQAENIDAARGHIMDADIAEEVSKLAQAQILQSAGMSVVAQANASSAKALQLLA